MIDLLDIRFGKVCEIKPFSEKPDSPRRKYCTIKVEFPELGIVKQSVGQFARHKTDMLGQTVLCLINLGTRNMFGQPSEILILGIPHPDGGVIPGDAHEAQASFLKPAVPHSATGTDEMKPAARFEDWSATDIRLAQVTAQRDDALEATVEGRTLIVPLRSPMGEDLIGQRLIIVLNSGLQDEGHLPKSSAGEPLFAQPHDARAAPGLKVY